jgi:hypothetical protein
MFVPAERGLWEGRDVQASVVVSQETHKPLPGLAYDVTHDVRRYRELVTQFGEGAARYLMLEEMSMDLMTHWAELGGEHGRIKAFSYKFRIVDGNLCEDLLVIKPVREMFEGQKSSEAIMWRDHMIPYLEQAPHGSLAFTLSERREGEYEGGYDYAYCFQKIGNEVLCFGLELDLCKDEVALILNTQYEELLLSDRVNVKHLSSDIRGRALFYPPGYFPSMHSALACIVGRPIRDSRGSFDYSDHQYLERYSCEQSEKLEALRGEVRVLAHQLLGRIITGELTQRHLALWQAEQLRFQGIDLMMQQNQQVLLPCGYVSFGQEDWRDPLGRFLEGGSYVEVETQMKCVTCPFCHDTVDAIVTTNKIKCPKCKSEVSR